MLPQRLSIGSVARYRAVIEAVERQRRSDHVADTIGLLDRKNDDALAFLDTVSRELRISEVELFDIILVEQPRGHRREPDFIALKARLATQGLILLRRRTRLSRWCGRLLARRRDDGTRSAFGTGHDRREAALRRAGLYLSPLRLPTANGNEQWLVASTAPLDDNRFRDQIGRVAMNYLRSLTPVTVGLGTVWPTL